MWSPGLGRHKALPLLLRRLRVGSSNLRKGSPWLPALLLSQSQAAFALSELVLQACRAQHIVHLSFETDRLHLNLGVCTVEAGADLLTHTGNIGVTNTASM